MKYATEEAFVGANAFGKGAANTAYAQYFVGNSYLNPLTDPQVTALHLSNVTFEPGCRNNWHIHHATKGGGQLLICTAGEGWYQEWGKAPVALHEGMVITSSPEVKHWHGAKGNIKYGQRCSVPNQGSAPVSALHRLSSQPERHGLHCKSRQAITQKPRTPLHSSTPCGGVLYVYAVKGW